MIEADPTAKYVSKVSMQQARPELRERLGLLPRPVLEDEFVPRPNEILGHARTHACNSDEADFHRHVSPRAA